MENAVLRTLIIFILTIISIDSYSQIVNIQPFLRSKAKEGFSTTVNGSLNWKTGNTETLEVEGGLALRYRLKKNLFLGISEIAYADKKGTQYVNKTFNHLRYRRQFTQFWSAEVFAQYEFDEFRRIDTRALIGLGPRITPLRLKSFELSLGTAYMFEYNKNREGNYGDSGDINKYHRWSNYINLDFKIDKTFDLFITVYYQPRFDDFNDYRILNDNSLSIKIKPWLKLVNSFVLAYNSRPLISVTNMDTRLKTALQFTYE